MWRSLWAVTPAGQRRLAARRAERLGGGHDGPDDALAGVVLVAAAAARGREDESAWIRLPGGVPVAREFVAEGREDVDQPLAGCGLGVADADAAVGRVDGGPGERRRLSDSQPGEDQRRDQRTTRGARSRVRVERAGSLDRRGDLLGRAQILRG